ncbi:inositol 1,4,5-trisphosphate receptor-interacting protein-like 1 [Prinia subflava]|uniref:inositol 1,4,5-trisphosphate receptor-interacting protein-like 1 n=1 Tax=Prinia subflava TaxID=208062 RepID=UPI002FE13AA5
MGAAINRSSGQRRPSAASASVQRARRREAVLNGERGPRQRRQYPGRRFSPGTQRPVPHGSAFGRARGCCRSSGAGLAARRLPGPLSCLCIPGPPVPTSPIRTSLPSPLDPCSIPQAMLAITFLLLLAQGLIQYPQQAGDGLDEATRERMQLRAEYLSQQMAQLLQELEQKNLEQSGGAWAALLLWQWWALTGILVLLLAVWFGLGKMRCDPPNSGHKERCSSNSVEEEGHIVVAKKETESNDANVEEGSKDGNEEGSDVEGKAESNIGNEAKEGNGDAKEELNRDEKGAEANAAANEEDKQGAKEEDSEPNVQRSLGSLLEERLAWPVLDLHKGCSLITDLADKLTHVFRQGLSDGFYPVPQQAIGVGSAFEGWSPHAQDVVYSVLVPLSPPPGHAFHLDLDTAGMLQRNFCVRVELLCTCRREQLGEENMLCFLHHPEEELRRRQEPSLLHTLCTGSYLDVEKTVRWFYRFVRVAWLLLPQSRHWRLTLQPSSRSCKFQLSKDGESFAAEMIFAVRQGDSDIFVGSRPTEVGVPSTTWIETYAVAEAKFFSHVSRQAPQDSCHCKCLQLLTHLPMGVAFPSYAVKTVVMHLLNGVPLTRWSRRDFQQRLMDILKYLQCSLEIKQLRHFVIGNECLPGEIRLPSGFRVAEPPNLFQHLASSADAHLRATQEFILLLQQVKQLLTHSP